MAMSTYPWEPLTTLEQRFAGNTIEMGKDVSIHPSAVIEGPVIIGDHTTIGVGAYIRPYTVIGKHCVIGHASEVKHSILGDYVVVPHFNYVGDSILGNHVHLGGGAMLANFKSDGTTIKAIINGEKVDTGLKKFGAVLGENVEIGAGAILNPGTIVGENTTIYAGASVRGFVPANSILKVKAEQDIVSKK